MDQKMKTYSKPVIESIDIQSADCFMQLGRSGDHMTTTPAPAREPQQTPF